MQYISTRNTKQTFTFKDIFLKGLAADGGLYIPEKIPSYSLKELESLKELSYEQLAVKIIFNFCSDEFNEIEIQILRHLTEKKDCSLTFLAANTGLTKSCVQKDFEMYLQKMNLMEITTAGRGITAKGQETLQEIENMKS